MSKVNELILQLCPEGVVFKELKEVGIITIGEFVHKNKQNASAKYPVYNGGTSYTGFYEEFNNTANKIVISARGANAGFVNRVLVDYWAGNSCYSISFKDPSHINWNFAFYYLKLNQNKLIGDQQRGGIPAVSKKMVEQFKLPIPPLEIQNEIVSILDKFTLLEAALEAELEARKAQYEHYRDALLSFEGKDVLWKTLNEISINLDSKRKPVKGSDREKGKYPYYGASGIVDYVSSYIFDGDFLLISEDGANLLARNTPIAFSISGKTWVNNHAHILKFDNYATRRLVEFYLNSIELTKYISGASQPKLNKENLNKIPIPIPLLSEQKRIVSILDKFDALLNDISIGLPAEIEARRKQYEYYRNQLLTFKSSSNG